MYVAREVSSIITQDFRIIGTGWTIQMVLVLEAGHAGLATLPGITKKGDERAACHLAFISVPFQDS
jgi:hypothetical protein